MGTREKPKFGAPFELPGPGTYKHEIDNTGGGYMGDAPCYSMGARKAVPKPDDSSPGPVYSPRAITPRATGPIGDAPDYSFGSSKRWGDAGSKVPGPGTHDGHLVTRTGGSIIVNSDAPKYGFGTAAQRIASEFSRGNRFISKEHSNKSNYAVHSPGPLAYSRAYGMGANLTGTSEPNSPRYTMRPRLAGFESAGTGGGGGGGGSDSAKGKIEQPGPGTYNQAMGFGNQVLSARNSSANFSFGTSTRHRPELNPKKTVYMGKAYERQNWGINSPGPQQYSTQNSTQNPGYKASPSFSFGSEDRFAY